MTKHLIYYFIYLFKNITTLQCRVVSFLDSTRVLMVEVEGVEPSSSIFHYFVTIYVFDNTTDSVFQYNILYTGFPFLMPILVLLKVSFNLFHGKGHYCQVVHKSKTRYEVRHEIEGHDEI